MSSWASGGAGTWLPADPSVLQGQGQPCSQGSKRRGWGALGGGDFVEKKLMLLLVTTLPRQRPQRRTSLLLPPKSWVTGYSWVSGVQCQSSSFYFQTPLLIPKGSCPHAHTGSASSSGTSASNRSDQKAIKQYQLIIQCPRARLALHVHHL